MFVLSIAALSACSGYDEDAVNAASQSIPVSVESTGVTSTQQLINLCVEKGETGQMCACNILAIEGALDAEEFANFAEQAKQNDEHASEYLEQILSDRTEVALEMAQSIQGCLGG